MNRISTSSPIARAALPEDRGRPDHHQDGEGGHRDEDRDPPGSAHPQLEDGQPPDHVLPSNPRLCQDGPPGASISSTRTPWHERGWMNATGPFRATARRAVDQLEAVDLEAEQGLGEVRRPRNRRDGTLRPCSRGSARRRSSRPSARRAPPWTRPTVRKAIRTRSAGMSITVSSSSPSDVAPEARARHRSSATIRAT